MKTLEITHNRMIWRQTRKAFESPTHSCVVASKVFIALITKLCFQKLKLTVVSRRPHSFGVTFCALNMENIKQLMANVDSYMKKLIEAVELIETGDFPHSEGQFFIFLFVLPWPGIAYSANRSESDEWKFPPRSYLGSISKKQKKRRKHFHELRSCVESTHNKRYLRTIVNLDLHANCWLISIPPDLISTLVALSNIAKSKIRCQA